MPTIKKYQEKNEKAEYAYKFYLNKGYTPAQSSAIVGNLIRESALNPSAVGDSGKAFGLAQWHPDRQAKAKGLYGEKWKDFDNQLEFVHWELNNTEKPAGDALKKTKSVWEAGRVFTNSYERPKLKFDQDETRQTHVADVYRNYAKMQLTEEDKNMFKPTFAKDVAPYMNQVTTNDVTDFDISIDSTNFASVPDVPQKEEQTKTEEALNTLKEKEFVEQYKSFFTEQKAPEQQEQPQQVIQPTDVQGIFNEVNQFVDSPVAQSGGTVQTTNDRSYYDPRIDQIKLGIDYSGWVKDAGLQEDLIKHELYHKKQYDEGRTNFDIAHNTEDAQWAQMQKRPELTSTDEVWFNFHDRKGWENKIDIDNFKEKIPEKNIIGDNLNSLIYERYVDIPQYSNPNSMEGEADFFAKTNKEFHKLQQGGIPISKDGVYAYPGQEVIVPTTDGRITMSKVTYPILGIDEYGNSQMMMPGEEYQFKGKTIHEYPQLTDKEKAFFKVLNTK